MYYYILFKRGKQTMRTWPHEDTYESALEAAQKLTDDGYKNVRIIQKVIVEQVIWKDGKEVVE